jgi:hypothetical protein
MRNRPIGEIALMCRDAELERILARLDGPGPAAFVLAGGPEPLGIPLVEQLTDPACLEDAEARGFVQPGRQRLPWRLSLGWRFSCVSRSSRRIPELRSCEPVTAVTRNKLRASGFQTRRCRSAARHRGA